MTYPKLSAFSIMGNPASLCILLIRLDGDLYYIGLDLEINWAARLLRRIAKHVVDPSESSDAADAIPPLRETGFFASASPTLL